MKHFIMATLLILPMSVAKAQNLVENGSFEEYYDCPMFGAWTEVVGWTSPYTTSADYFNACTGDTNAGVPYNQLGYQWAADGQAYIGIATYVADDPLYREFMSTELVEPLQVGVPVCLSFKMAMGGFGSMGFVNSAIHTAKGVGLKFFTELPETSQPWLFSEWASYLYPNSAALYLDVVPTDTAIWYEVTGTYIPDSAYRYLVAGNFFEDSLCDPFQFDTVGHGNMNAAYAFIDDVRASYDLTYCDYSTGVGTLAADGLRVYPNPCQEIVHVEIDAGWVGTHDVDLYNSAGGLVLTYKGHIGPVISLSLASLPAGLYHLRITDPSGASHSSAIVHLTF